MSLSTPLTPSSSWGAASAAHASRRRRLSEPSFAPRHGRERADRMSARAEAVCRQWLRARERCDLAALGDLTAPDAVWHSPVDGAHHGRDNVVEQVRAGFADTEQFATETLSIEAGVDQVVACVRNTGRRDSELLDSRQLLLMLVRDGLVAEVRVVVDDPDAVRRFWSDGEPRGSRTLRR